MLFNYSVYRYGEKERKYTHPNVVLHVIEGEKPQTHVEYYVCKKKKKNISFPLFGFIEQVHLHI